MAQDVEHPLVVHGSVPRDAPVPSMPVDPGLLPGSSRAGGRESTKPKTCHPPGSGGRREFPEQLTGVKLRWEATHMGNSPFPDRAGVGSVPSRDRGMVPAAESTDSGVAPVVIALTPLWPVFQPRNNQ